MTEAQEKTAAEEQKKKPAKKHTDHKAEAQKTAVPAVAAEATQSTTTNQSGPGLVSFAALIFAIGTLAAGYAVWQQMNQQQQDLTKRLTETEKTMAGFESSSASSLSVAQTVQISNQLMQDRLQTLETRIDTGLTKLEKNNATLNESLTSISNNVREKKGDDWLVAEARHLINIANHQSQLNYNSNAATAALETADRRLRDAADPSLISVRQIITDDIIALRNITPIDITGIALKLSQLESQVEQLPLLSDIKSQTRTDKTEVTAETTEASTIEGFANQVWDDIKGLVSVRRNDGPQGAALLPPGQRFFLQQNLRLKLEAARLALLQRDTQTFHNSLATASQWIENYFDRSAPGTANLLTSLSPYQGLELKPQLPDISNAMRALDEWQQQRSKASNSEEQPS